MKVVVNYGEDFVQTNEAILKLACGKQDLHPVFVLVPDRFTLQAERWMLKNCDKLLNTRVITFSMLFQIVAEELNHGEKAAVLDKTTAVLHLWTAIRAVQDQLLWFKKSVAHYDFAEKLYNTIGQMRSSCVNFTAMESLAKTAVAKKKYHDINLIYQKYRELLQNSTDSSGMLEYLINGIPQSAMVKNADFYVCGFENFSPARLAVIDRLCRGAKSVTMGATTFEVQQQLAKYSTVKLATVKPANTTHKAHCETSRQEAEFVAQRVVELLNQGVPAEEIMVLLADFDKLAPVWQVMFAKYKIPTNLDVGQKLSETAEAKYLRDLLELALNDNAENTVAVIFNACSGLGEEVYALENKIIKSDLRARYVDEVQKIQATREVGTLCAALRAFTTQEKLLNILDKIESCLGTQEIALREFIALFWTLCGATKISNIPLYVDRVLIAAVEEWVPSRCQYLFIANCTEENFPQGQSDDDILQEADLVNTGITPTPKLQRSRNYQHAQLLLALPTQAVYLSGTNEEFRPPVDKGATTGNEVFHRVPAVPPSTGKIYDDQSRLTVAKELFFPQNRVKTTMLERYYSCPYLNFIQNGLKLQPREIYKLEPNDLGSAIHEALEKYFTGSTVDEAIQAALRRLAYDCPPITENLQKEIRFIIKRLQESTDNGAFKVWGVEKEIKRRLACGLDLVGRVDRVDLATVDGKNLIMVLDYKTGTAPSGIAKEIYLGSKLQLPLYANALREVGELAGAGYLSLPRGYGEDKKKIKINGFINKAYKTLFDAEIVNPNSRQFFEGAVLEKVCTHAEQMANQAVTEICQGNTTPQAVSEGTCKFCPVKTLCKNAGNNCRSKQVSFSFPDFLGGEPK